MGVFEQDKKGWTKKFKSLARKWNRQGRRLKKLNENRKV